MAALFSFVSSISGPRKNPRWRTSASSSTKQCSQADKVDSLTSQAGWQCCKACLPCFGPAYFVLSFASKLTKQQIGLLLL